MTGWILRNRVATSGRWTVHLSDRREILARFSVPSLVFLEQLHVLAIVRVFSLNSSRVKAPRGGEENKEFG